MSSKRAVLVVSPGLSIRFEAKDEVWKVSDKPMVKMAAYAFKKNSQPMLNLTNADTFLTDGSHRQLVLTDNPGLKLFALGS